MTPRALRRAQERKAEKLSRKLARQSALAKSRNGAGSVSDPKAENSPIAANSIAERNQQNAQLSTGPRTEAGKTTSARNNFRHGLASGQLIIPGEDPAGFESLLEDLQAEHQPSTTTEEILVRKMAEHYWLSQRAVRFQTEHLMFGPLEEKKFSLFLRYQTTNDRGFSKCLNELLKLRAERRKARMDEAALSQLAEDSKIGFESQKQKQAESEQKQKLLEARARLTNAKAADQEIETEVRRSIEAPLPGNIRIPFEHVKHVMTSSLKALAEEMTDKAAA